jgi:hypothetical protein
MTFNAGSKLARKPLMEDATQRTNDQATPPANSGGLTREDFNTLLADALKPIVEQVTTTAKNQQILADTISKLPPAAPAATAADGTAAAAAGGGGAKKAEPLTPDAVQKLIGDAIAADRQAQQQTAEQRAARDAFVKSDNSGLARIAPAAAALGFDITSKLGTDPNKWGEEAKSIAGGWEQFARANKIPLGDVGGGARDGNNPADAGAGAAAGGGAGDQGGGFLKMPAAPAAPAR